MKQYLFFVAFICNFGFNAFCQNATNTELKDSTNLYFQALSSYVKYLDKSGSKERKLFVERNSLITDKLPSQFGSFEIAYLDGNGIMKELGRKSEIKVIRIVHLRVQDSKFFINIIPFTVKANKKNLNYINSGGEQVVFKFDSMTGKFHFLEIVHGGI